MDNFNPAGKTMSLSRLDCHSSIKHKFIFFDLHSDCFACLLTEFSKGFFILFLNCGQGQDSTRIGEQCLIAFTWFHLHSLSCTMHYVLLLENVQIWSPHARPRISVYLAILLNKNTECWPMELFLFNKVSSVWYENDPCFKIRASRI